MGLLDAKALYIASLSCKRKSRLNQTTFISSLDEQYYRVGYGKGFYDRFLANCRKDVKKIGLNFFKPISNITDVNEFDIALDEVIYPK